MKKEYSNKWIGSKQVRKQRKYRYNAPLHVRQKFMASNLSKELRKKMGKRSVKLRKNDKVKILRGEFRGKSGKITMIDLKKTRIAIEGIQRQKKEGTKINVFFNPSKVQVIELGEDRKMKQEKKTETKQIKKEDKTENKEKIEGEKNAPEKK